MRQIKFRGRVPDTDCIKLERGTIRYGALMTFAEGIAGYTHWIIEGYRNYPVDPDTVAQLVGYDSNGAEVYEGDVLIDAFGNQYEVQFYPMGVNDNDCISLADSAKLNLVLKEAQNEDARS